MIAYSFHAGGKGAAGSARVGREQHGMCRPFLTGGGPAYRAQQVGGGEQQLVAHLVESLGATFPRTLLVTYYVSLKTNPFVVLTGPEGAGKAALAAGFARAVLGAESGQFITIGSDSWTRHGSQSNYYRGIHERFGASQFLAALHEAAAPESAGKVFLILLKGLTFEELDGYVNRILHVDAHGERRLVLPGVPAAERPVVPPNCFITATLHLSRAATQFDQQVLRHAGQIEFSPDLHVDHTLPELPPPPVGLQRVMLAASNHDARRARARLTELLGGRAVRTLAPSAAVAARLLAMGAPISRTLREDSLSYVANSFDSDGRGLFDPTNPQHNAQIAYDAQVLQRLLWRAEQPAHDLSLALD